MATIIKRTKLRWLRKQVIVLCHGVYDIISVAHLRHLRFAKERGDLLVVSVTGDEHVNKGESRPYFTAQHRAEFLCGLTMVDYVVINDAPNALPVIEELMPDFYVKGFDTKRAPGDDFNLECAAVEKCGGMVIYSPNEYEAHTSDIINGIRT